MSSVEGLRVTHVSIWPDKPVRAISQRRDRASTGLVHGDYLEYRVPDVSGQDLAEVDANLFFRQDEIHGTYL